MNTGAHRRWPALTAAASALSLLALTASTLSASTENMSRIPAPVASPASSSARSLSAPAPSSAPVALPRLEYRKRTLANGLTVYSAPNHGSPTVAIQVWYHVGSKDDPANRSGFAHLFEHMMFKSTRNMRSEMLDRLTEDVGGENNAYTAGDVTVYHETVPSNYLETLLWAEADRMTSLSVSAENFASEKSVVKEEYRQGVLADPYGRLGIYLNEKSWAVHPYRHDTIGSIRDLDAADLEDVQSFYRTFYRPDNATLVVVGDFDPAQLDTWVDRYFGKIPRPTGEIPRITAKEPARTQERRYRMTAPNVPLPAVALTYLVPPASDADAEALQVANIILSAGEASRLYRALVYEQRVASQAYGYPDLRTDAGMWIFEAVAAGNKTPAAVEKSLLAEIERLKAAPPSAAELEKARNQLLSDFLEERETNDGLASALGDAAVMLKDPERVNTDLARLQAVTVEDVQRVARKYLVPENRVVLWYESGKVAPDPGAAGVKAAAAAAAPSSLSFGSGAMEIPPAPAAPRNVTFPLPVEKKLANGVRVVVVPKAGTGLVSVELAIRKAGGANDPTPKAGLADFTASLLTRGTRTRSAPRIAEEIEALGGSLTSGASWDDATISLSVMRSKLEQALPLMADVTLNPAFDNKEITRLREEELDALAVDLEEPGTLARYVAARVTFGDLPYGHPLGGTLESLRRLQRVDVLTFYNRTFQPGQAVLVFGGDILPEEAFTLAEKHFGIWKNRPMAGTSAIPQKSPTATRRIVVIDRADAGQSAVIVARPGIRRTDPDYYRALVANGVLGTGFSSRINQEIRIKRGLSYGAGSAVVPRAEVGPFVASAQTKHESAPEVATLLLGELERLAQGELPEAELTSRRAALRGDYARSLETGAGLAAEAAELALYDLPLSEISAYLPGVDAVTSEEVRKFAAARLSAKEASVVIVGAASKFLPDLKKRFPGAPIKVIPAGRLDLNRSDLVRK